MKLRKNQSRFGGAEKRRRHRLSVDRVRYVAACEHALDRRVGRTGLHRQVLGIVIFSGVSFATLLTLFVVRDFIQWNVHRLLHRVPFLWEFHKVHHSVQEMGFAAHLRYHWMENFVYKLIQFLPLGLLGFDLIDFFIMDIF